MATSNSSSSGSSSSGSSGSSGTGTGSSSNASRDHLEAATIDHDEDVEDVIKAPMVFSCIKCHVIVGDTYALLKTSAETNTITLTGASRVSRSADVYTSKVGPDVGSTYFRFNCSNCQAVLGRYYLTTARDLDDLREKFTFSVDAVASYELGKAQFGKAENVPESMPTASSSASSSGLPLSDASAAAAAAAGEVEGAERLGRGGEDAEGTEGEILKIQHVMMNQAERLDRLEHTTAQLAQLMQTVQLLLANAHALQPPPLLLPQPQPQTQPQRGTKSSNNNSSSSSSRSEPTAKRQKS